MSISLDEFVVSMTIYGAKKLPKEYKSDFRCRFKVGFLILEPADIGDRVLIATMEKSYNLNDVIRKANAEIGAGHFDNKYKEILSVRGLFTLVSMCDGKYSREFVDELINMLYQTLLEPFTENRKMTELRRLVFEDYDSIMNPFKNPTICLKEPVEYIEKLAIKVEYCRIQFKIPNLELSINGMDKYYSVRYRSANGDAINIIHDIAKGHICLRKKASEFYQLVINLSTGRAQENLYTSVHTATDEQIETMIAYVNEAIKRVKQNILVHMLKE